mgnify:CR=1 FL=1
MKIERLDHVAFDNENHVNRHTILHMRDVINKLIDAYNQTAIGCQPDLTFEEALLHYKAGKKIGRKIWDLDEYFDMQDSDDIRTENFNYNDWRVIE